MLRSPGPPGRLTSTTRSRVGIGITSLRCFQYRCHVIPVGPIVNVPCVNDRGKPSAWPLRKQLTLRDSPPSRAARSLLCFDSAVPEGSVTVSTGWRSTSSRDREPPARRGLLTQSGCHRQRFRRWISAGRGHLLGRIAFLWRGGVMEERDITALTLAGPIGEFCSQANDEQSNRFTGGGWLRHLNRAVLEAVATWFPSLPSTTHRWLPRWCLGECEPALKPRHRARIPRSEWEPRRSGRH